MRAFENFDPVAIGTDAVDARSKSTFDVITLMQKSSGFRF